jgi:tRNA (cmo5U34)-methyltransferase
MGLMPADEWTTTDHVQRYLERADSYPRRDEGERALLEHMPRRLRRVLDLGTGDGRLLGLLRADRGGEHEGVGLDLSEQMLVAARERFAGDERIELVRHDLAEPLPRLGRFDAVVSSFAIHHLEHERKRSLYGEVLDLLEPGGVFANLEHVASPTERLHVAFFAAIGEPLEDEDPSDRTLDVERQVAWLRELGFDDADCSWKWREMALLVGVRPEASSSHSSKPAAAGARSVHAMTGEPSFFELGVADADRARAFYTTLFGWRMEPGPSGAGFVIDTGATPGGLHPGDPEAAPYLFFRVDDIEAVAARVGELGGTVEQIDVEGDDDSVGRFGRFRICRDDQGSPFGLHQPPA